MKVAVFGTGYWAQFQIAAWQSIGVQVVALWNRTKEKAEAAAARFGIPFVGVTPQEVFEKADFDLADIVTDAEAHEALVLLSARYKKPVICQKPLALSGASCDRMVAACEKAGVWFAVHENFRYQIPLRRLKELVEEGLIGRPVRAQLQLKSPDRDIISRQPALITMDSMVLRDMGPHLFDVARSLFGEAESIYARTLCAYPDIGAQDTAHCLLVMKSGLLLSCDLIHTFYHKAFIEGEKGSLLLDRNNRIQLITPEGTKNLPVPEAEPLPYIPSEDLSIHGSHIFNAIPLCLTALKKAFCANEPAETSGRDNRESMRLVFAAIRSNKEGRVVPLDEAGL